MLKRIGLLAPVLSLGAALALAALPSVVSAAIVADSVADFSSTQGGNNWYYLVQPGSDTLMGLDAGDRMDLFAGSFFGIGGSTPHWRTPNRTSDAVDGFYTSWMAANGHAGASGNEKGVRRWVSEVTGLVDITGSLARTFQAVSGNGVSMGVFKNGTQLGGFYDATNGSPASINLTNISVSSGDFIDFVLYNTPGGTMGSNFDSDYVDFSAQINTVPEPASLGLLAVGVVTVFARRRRA